MSKISRDAACRVHNVSAHQFGHYTLWAGAVTSNGRVIPIPTPLTSTNSSADKNTSNDKNLLIVFASASVNESDEQEADRNILSFHLLKLAKVPDIPIR